MFDPNGVFFVICIGQARVIARVRACVRLGGVVGRGAVEKG